MKTKTTNSVDQNDLLDIEKIAMEMAASAVTPATAEAKMVKVPKKKVTKAEPVAEQPVDDTAIETVVEGIADKVVIVADSPT